MGRTQNEIIADIERWANERIATGEEVIYSNKMPKSTPASGTDSPLVESGRTKVRPTKAANLPVVVHTEIIEAWKSAMDLPTLNSMISGCTKCELHKTRTKFVFGVGNPNAKVMVIGEAPGKDEDEQGEPFVGRAGQLLNKMLQAINFPREEVFIANILKSRPPGNRDPRPEEVAACEPYLFRQIEIIKPKMILCVGRIAGSNLLKFEGESLAKMRGQVFDFMNAKVMVTYHPAALLRNPNWKVGAWEDLQKFRKLYDELVPT
jgi:uracil-DNA glycosylase family 4